MKRQFLVYSRGLSFVFIAVLFLFSSLIETKISADEKIKKVVFETTHIKIKNKKIKVEVAQTPEQHERGLMYRTRLGVDEGMIFIFQSERILSFWMKNTLIDLSIAYINKQKKIIDIQEMKAQSILSTKELLSYPSREPAMYALEMNKNWFKNNKIFVGDKIQFQDPRLDISAK